MKRVRKIITGLLAVMLAIGVMGPVTAKAAGEPSLNIITPDNKVLTYKAGQSQTFVLNVTNTGGTALTDITIAPKLRNNSDKWPFKTEYQSYTETIPRLEAAGTEGSQGSVSFDFTQREDIPTGRYILTFDITATDGETTLNSERSFYVNTTAKPQDVNNQDNNTQNAQDPSADGGNSGGGVPDLLSAAAGGFDNGGASYVGGGDSSATGSVPRVIITGFDTNPAEVKAGSNFTLTIHLKNTSKATKVSNMLFDLAAPTEGTDEQTTAPAFLPASGASSIYLDGIKADGTADISINLNAKADLVQKPYSINMSMKYEDSSAAQIEGSSSISIPVKQDARFEFSEFEITPETIAVGEEGNVNCNLYNLGRIKLYNVKAAFEGKGIKKEEVFIGNVEPGATASIDVMLEGKQVVSDSDKVKMTMTYEDEAGTQSKEEKELTIQVTEAIDDMNAMMDVPVEESKGLPILPIVIAAAVIAAVIAIIIICKKKKSKLLSEEEEGLLDELDGPSEDE